MPIYLRYILLKGTLDRLRVIPRRSLLQATLRTDLDADTSWERAEFMRDQLLDLGGIDHGPEDSSHKLYRRKQRNHDSPL